MVARMRNRAATWVNLVFASIVAIGVFFQAYFIAAYASGAGEGALDAHAFTGGLVIHASELIVLISGLVAFWGIWKWAGLSAFLFVFGTVQIFLSPGDDPANGWVHGLHGLFALFVLVLAAVIANHDLRLLGLMRERPKPTEPAPPPV
jgi:hypothetical protein